MDFELNDEQQALQDSVQRLLRDMYGFDQRRALVASGWSEPVWRKLTELGACGLLVPPEAGGFGGRHEDVLPVMQSLGAALSLEPYLACAVLAATALRSVPPSHVARQALESIATGDGVIVWAHDEPGMRGSPQRLQTCAHSDGGDWVLNGEKCTVLHGDHASAFVVTAQMQPHKQNPPIGEGGQALFLVQAQAEGLQRTAYRLVDDSPAADLLFADVHAQPLCLDDAGAREAIRATLDAGISAVCADAVGAMGAAFELASSYVQTRRQFDRLIGENQALRHRLADMFVSLEMCRSMAIAAAVAADRASETGEPREPDAALDLMRAKLMIGQHARAVCHGAIQLHGGIGMTEEYAVGHYLRRVTLLDQLFGDADTQATRLGQLLALQSGA